MARWWGPGQAGFGYFEAGRMHVPEPAGTVLAALALLGLSRWRRLHG